MNFFFFLNGLTVFSQKTDDGDVGDRIKKAGGSTERGETDRMRAKE